MNSVAAVPFCVLNCVPRRTEPKTLPKTTENVLQYYIYVKLFYFYSNFTVDTYMFEYKSVVIAGYHHIYSKKYEISAF